VKGCVTVGVGMSSWILVLKVSKDVAEMVDSGSWFQILIITVDEKKGFLLMVVWQNGVHVWML
jgi:hypothetical protein